MRKLASIQRIAEIRSIPNSDNLAHYRINGWWVVDRIGAYNLGDLVIYFEVDSWIPTELAPFLSKGKEPRSFNNVKGERLRTIKLRGALSQGLILPLTFEANLGDDVTEQLGIQKYEKPLPQSLAGKARGNFPSFIQKTDQDRIQNLSPDDYLSFTFVATEKLDGSSCTIYRKDGTFGVCSRNLDLQLDQEGNAFVNLANSYFNNPTFVQAWNEVEASIGEFAIQGELLGGKIQGNPYKLPEGQYKLFVFHLWSIAHQEYLPNYPQVAAQLGLDTVPNLGYVTVNSLQDILLYAEGKSRLADVEREGIVLHLEEDPNISFKVISNKWLLNEK